MIPRINEADQENGFGLSFDFFIGDECLRVFPKPFSFGYWFHQCGFYGFGAGWIGFMFWSAKSKSAVLLQDFRGRKTHN